MVLILFSCSTQSMHVRFGCSSTRSATSAMSMLLYLRKSGRMPPVAVTVPARRLRDSRALSDMSTDRAPTGASAPDAWRWQGSLGGSAGHMSIDIGRAGLHRSNLPNATMRPMMHATRSRLRLRTTRSLRQRLASETAIWVCPPPRIRHVLQFGNQHSCIEERRFHLRQTSH